MATMFRGTTRAKDNNTKADVFEVKKYIKRFNIEELETKHDAQRQLSEAWVQEIIDNWDERTCTPPVVVIDKNNKNLVVDGQHRLEAMKKLGYKQVECFLIQGISASEAFLMINNIKPIESLDKFIQKAKTEAYERRITEIFANQEIELSADDINNRICFADADYLWALEKDFNENALKAALEIIADIVEYDGKISKILVSKLYNLFNENPNLYNKAHKEMLSLKDSYSSDFKRNSRKTINAMQKRFPKSKIDVEILKLVQ